MHRWLYLLISVAVLALACGNDNSIGQKYFNDEFFTPVPPDGYEKQIGFRLISTEFVVAPKRYPSDPKPEYYAVRALCELENKGDVLILADTVLSLNLGSTNGTITAGGRQGVERFVPKSKRMVRITCLMYSNGKLPGDFVSRPNVKFELSNWSIEFQGINERSGIGGFSI